MPNMSNERCVAFFTEETLSILANTETHIEGSKLPPEYYFQVAKLDPAICTLTRDPLSNEDIIPPRAINGDEIEHFKKLFSDKLNKEKCKAGDLPGFFNKNNDYGIIIDTTKWHSGDDDRESRGSRAQEAMAGAYVKEIVHCLRDIREGNFDKLPKNFKTLLALRINKILPMEFSHRGDETTWSSACSANNMLQFTSPGQGGGRGQDGGKGQDAGMLAALTDSIINIASQKDGVLGTLETSAKEHYTNNLSDIVLDDPRFASTTFEQNDYSIEGDFASHGIQVEEYRKLFAKEFKLGLGEVNIYIENPVSTPEWNINPHNATINSDKAINIYKGKGGFAKYKKASAAAAAAAPTASPAAAPAPAAAPTASPAASAAPTAADIELYNKNANFDIDRVGFAVDGDLRESQKEELLAAAHRFIAFEYVDERGRVKSEYRALELKNIHSTFKDGVIEVARHAVCGGDDKKFEAEKKESIYQGVDKFKATIDSNGYLVIYSVGDTINDDHFKNGVVTKFKFPVSSGVSNELPRTITKDNLSSLFTDNSEVKDSGLSLLSAIELAFGALKEIKKNQEGKLIDLHNNNKFNAIFPDYKNSRALDVVLEDAPVASGAQAGRAAAPAEGASEAQAGRAAPTAQAGGAAAPSEEGSVANERTKFTGPSNNPNNPISDEKKGRGGNAKTNGVGL